MLLAGSADAQSVFADPAVLEKDERAGEALRKVAQTLKLDAGAVRKKLAKGSRFVWIARRISPAERATVMDARARGVARRFVR